ncbi:MAG: PLP-dependent aminotransferase family protein [Chloroflexi bacterium]|nr:PLP-dependent aminotransferase family protein [Chloroflexota bacterium]
MKELSIRLERGAKTPLYEQLKQHLIEQIRSGVLPPGARLPATRDLADQLDIGRISVVSAYEDLKQAGYLEAHVGRGTFVADHPPEENTAALTGSAFFQDASIRELVRMAARPGVISFAMGTPPDEFLPVGIIQQAIDAVLARDGASALAYEAPEGFSPLREAIAQMVGESGIEVRADDVLITGGCQQALDLAVQALLNPGDVVLTSSPTYAGFLDIAQARGITPVGVPVDRYGMRTDMLEALIAENRPRLLYVAPTYHNPTGTVMPAYRREELLAVAAQYRLPVLEDGVYQDLTFTTAPPPPLKAMDDTDLVMHASSFSKIMMPGMRIGYLIVGERLRRRLVRVKQAADVCTPALNQRAMHHVLTGGQLNTHLEAVRSALLTRRSALLDALERHLPEAAWHEPKGGLYVWVLLPEDGPSAAELLVHAIGQGTAFAPGPLFHLDGAGVHALRLNLAAHPPDVIEEGVRRLGFVWAQQAEHYQPASRPTSPLL